MNFEQEDSGEAGSSWVHSCARYEIEPSVTDSSGGNPVLPHGPGGSHREGEASVAARIPLACQDGRRRGHALGGTDRSAPTAAPTVAAGAAITV
jgi:hypothetical protein